MNLNNNLPEDFNINNYRLINNDLQSFSDEQLINHYILYGKYENRSYKFILPKDFNVNSYRLLNNDLNIFSDNELINHYFFNGANENRLYKPEKDFNLFAYKMFNKDLDNFSDEQLMNHYILYGKYENRIYKFDEFKDDNSIINDHKDINYNNETFTNFNEKINFILNKINIYLIKTNLNYDKTTNLNINYFNNIEIKNPYDKIIDNIELFKIFEKNNLDNVLIINSNNINFDYLKYHKISLNQIINNTKDEGDDYDIIELSLINYRSEFYEIIESDIKIYDSTKNIFDAYLITKVGYEKILNNYKNENTNNLLINCKIGYYSRPFFGYNIDLYDNINNIHSIDYYLSKNLWDAYYRVTSYWNKIYCINLGFDIEKRRKMKKYCNLLNSNENDFFYDGILGLNLPNINTLINMGLYNSFILNKINTNIKIGTMGLNITQLDIINNSINNNYNYTLILEDDVSFNSNYFETLDLIFNKYKNIDILYLGFVMGNNTLSDIFDQIDFINNYSVYVPKKNLCKKIFIGGFFAVLLSNKALKIYLDRYMPINNISDVLLCDIAFDIKKNLSNNFYTKTNYNLNSIFIDDFIDVDINKQSLTEDNNFNMINNFKENKELNYLSKTKKLNFKIKHKYLIKLYISEFIKLYYTKLISIIINIIPNIKILDYYDEDVDILLYTCHDKLNLNNTNINICINGENRECQELTDIAIITRKNYSYSYNIYFPQMFASLWERKNDYYIIKNNTREYFCAYMYSYDVEYRVELYNFISKYKKVDALGKSCSNIENSDRHIYNDNITYNDIAVEKYSKYKFVLALENTIYDGYITEKIINPILANSIPIYAGPKDVFNLINKKRVIYVYDFNNYDDLLNYIIKVDNDNNLYNSIISEEIFIGNLNFSNFEDYLLLKLKKAFGLESKNILLSYNDPINYIDYDFIIHNFYTPYNDVKLIKRYLSDYINNNDNILLNYDKINFIDMILWINLDRSKKRQKYMNNILNDINIPNKRISAIDAKKSNFEKIIDNLDIKNTLSNYEIACTLSHLKAINYALNNNGNYFMICEDDISFYNIKYFTKSLQDIILEAPPFDILLLFKACLFELDNTYIKWKDYYDKGLDFYIYGTVCYIISRTGINKLKKYYNYDYSDNLDNFNINKQLNVADIYLYDELDTYVYKYNFVATLDENSTIHDSHLDFQRQCSCNQNNIILKDTKYI